MISLCTADRKPLVLTPEEFAKLTSQGVLQLQPPVTADVKPPQPTATTTTQLTHIPHDVSTRFIVTSTVKL